jgi:hypothetical protein
VGVELYLAHKLIVKVVFGVLQFARYTSASITLRYGTSRPKISSSSSSGRKGYFFASSDQTTIGILKV